MYQNQQMNNFFGGMGYQNQPYQHLLQAMDPSADLNALTNQSALESTKDWGHNFARGAWKMAQPENRQTLLEGGLGLIGNAFDFGEDLFRNTGTFIKKTGQMLPGGKSPTDNYGYFQYGWGKTPIADSLMDLTMPNFMGDFGDYGS